MNKKLGRQRIYKSEQSTDKSDHHKELKSSKLSKTKDGQTISPFAFEDHTKPKYGLHPETKPIKDKDIHSRKSTQKQVEE